LEWSAGLLEEGYLAEVLTFPGLQLLAGGIFSACWCRPVGQPQPEHPDEIPHGRICESSFGGPLHIVGPASVVDADGAPPVKEPEDADAPYVLDRFGLQVQGYSLEVDHDRIRIVDGDVACGGPGSAISSQSLLPPGVDVAAASVRPGIEVLAQLGRPSTVGQLAGASLAGYHPEVRAHLTSGTDPLGNKTVLMWPGLGATTAGIYRVCWCSSFRPTNAGERTADTDIFEEPPPPLNETNETWNDTNLTNESNSTEYEEHFKLPHHQPPWTYSKSHPRPPGAKRRLSAEELIEEGNSSNGSNTTGPGEGVEDNNSTNISNGSDVDVIVATDPIHPCSTDGMFDLDLGNFSIAGPTALQVIGAEGFDRRKVRVGFNFSLMVHGFGLGDGVSQRLRLILEPLRCGQPGTSNGTEHLVGDLAEDLDTPGVGPNPNKAQTWGPMSLSRSGLFYVCLCSGRGGRSCNEDMDFQVQVGSVVAFWPDISLQHEHEPGVQLRVLPHVVFSFQFVGPELSVKDRVRIVELSQECGQPGSVSNTKELRGPLAVTPDIAGIPGSTKDGLTTLTWPDLRFMSGGVRRVCWCPAAGQAGAKPKDCSTAEDFYAEAGTFAALKVRDGWTGNCARAEEPILLHVAAVGLRPEMDRVLLVRASEVCGEGHPKMLNPGGVIGETSGFNALQCRQDPNAGAELRERKMICGGQDSMGAVRTHQSGTFQICICGAMPGYDCSKPEHYWTPAGKPIKVLMPSAAPVSAPRIPPFTLLTASSTATAAGFAPFPRGSARRMAAAYEDGKIRLWEPGVPEVTAELVGHVGRVEAVAWSPDGTLLLTGGLDGSIRLWGKEAGLGKGSTANGVHAVAPHLCPRWEPVWARPYGDMPDADWQNVILGHLLEMNPLNITEEPSVAFTDELPSEDLVDIGELTLQRAAKQCEKACGNFREMASKYCECGESLECHRLGNCVPKCGLEAHVWLRAHSATLTAVVMSPDGDVIASASFDTKVKIWDARKYKADALATISVHERAVLSLAFGSSNSGQTMLATGGDDDLITWYNVGALLAAGPRAKLAPFKSFHEDDGLGKNVAVLAVAFSPDSKWFAAAGFGGIGLVWNAQMYEKVRTLQPALPSANLARHSAVAGLTFSMDGNWLTLRGPAAVKMLPLQRLKDGLPPPDPKWVSFDGQDLGKSVLTWYSKPCPVGNEPQYGARRATNGTILEFYFAPCNVTEGCGESLPSVRIDASVPFDFVGVRGYFLEYSLGNDENLADDCRGGATQSQWDEETPARSYFTWLGRGESAEGLDCERVGPMGDEGRANLDACKQACRNSRLCNLINYRESAQNCDLRYCLNASSPLLGQNPDVDAHALIESDDTDELLDPTHDGYVMFGAPDGTGLGGVAYGGCAAGREVPRSGVWITIPETTVPRTSTLRFQVAQSRNTEIMAIGEIFLELLVPSDEEYTIEEPAASNAITVAPDRNEIVSTTAVYGGNLAVWDARGLDIPMANKEYKLKSVFDFEIRAPGLEDADRMRIVDGNDVANCGSPYSAVSTRDVQGPTHGKRDYGDESMSAWTGFAAMRPGNYRVCFCGGAGECCNVDGAYATELVNFVVSGAESDHYALCEVSLKNWPRTEIKVCKIENFRGTGIQEGDMIMVQTGTFCGVQDQPVPGLPNNGVMISRTPDPRDLSGVHVGGTWYRFEAENIPDDPGEVWGTYDAVPVMPAEGMLAKLCWCSKLSNCDPSNPKDFTIQAGRISLVRLEEDIQSTCFMKGPCAVKIQLEVSKPMAAGDQIVIKEGPRPWARLEGCKGKVAVGIGQAGDGYSSRLTVSTDGLTGTYDMGYVDTLTSGEYRMCWCQSSIQPCVSEEDFNFDAGKLFIAPADYVWPTCSFKDVSFNNWRDWKTFDDCCCNYDEAGAVGCKDEESETFKLCSAYPPR